MASMASPGFAVKTRVDIAEKRSSAYCKSSLSFYSLRRSQSSSSKVAARAAEEAAPPPLAVDDESPQPTPIGPKRGTKVKILRKESYWFNRTGSVVAVDQNPATRYPVVIRMNEVNYADVATNNFGLDEIEEVDDQ